MPGPIPPTKGQIRTMIRGMSPGAVTVAFLGDSITNDTGATTLGPQEYHFWAHILSDGLIQHAGKFGASGLGLLTTATNGSTWAQAMTALFAVDPKPDYCVILIGVNDLEAGGQSFAAVKAALTTAATQISNRGIKPVLCTLCPSDHTALDGTLRVKYHTFNLWASRFTRINGYGFIDFYSAFCEDNGDWQDGLNRDGIHPNATGARAMGQLVADAFAAGLPWSPYLAVDNADDIGFRNPLMLLDTLTDGSTNQTAGDGIPDRWGKANTMPGGILHTLEDATTQAHGNWYHQDRNGNTTGPILRSVKVAASQGDVIQMGFRLKLTAVAGGMLTGFTFNHYNGSIFTSTNLGSLWLPVSVASGQTFDLAEPVTLHAERIATQSGTVAIGCDLQTSTGDGELWLGQFTLRNLTTLGIV